MNKPLRPLLPRLTKVSEKRQIKVGCCGFAVAQKKYFELFEVVEVQQTFYQIPQIKTAEKWRHAAPPGFELTMKAWQLITHAPSSPTYRRLRERIDPIQADRYGGFQPTGEVMEALLLQASRHHQLCLYLYGHGTRNAPK